MAQVILAEAGATDETTFSEDEAARAREVDLERGGVNEAHHMHRVPNQGQNGESNEMKGLSGKSLGLGTLALVSVFAVLVWHWKSLTAFWIALDPVNAQGVCMGSDGETILFCDFANHYYPQGKEIFQSTAVVPGFFYPAPFAILMGALSVFGYNGALLLWLGMNLFAMAALFLLPQIDLFARRSSSAVVYGFLFLCSLAVLHNFIWAQVSAVVTMLVLAAFVLHSRGRRKTAAAALAIATSIKIYPAFFASYLLLKRDFRALAMFVAACAVLFFGVPMASLGWDWTVQFYGALSSMLGILARGAEHQPSSNYIANVMSMHFLGEVRPDSEIFREAKILGYGLSGFNGLLVYHLLKQRLEHEPYWAASLGFLSIPLLIGTSWVHYFVYLPFVQAFLFMMIVEGTERPWFKVGLGAAFGLPSVILSNVFFFEHLSSPNRYYVGGYLFWANACLLPLVYALIWSRSREKVTRKRPRQTTPGQWTGGPGTADPAHRARPSSRPHRSA